METKIIATTRYEAQVMRAGDIKTIAIAIAALLLTAGAGPSRAASFDCAKASSIVETLICRDPSLSQLDDRLSAAYSAARAQPGNSPQLSAEQRTWMARRNQCQTTACVSAAYSARLAELNAGMKTAPAISAPTSQTDNAPSNMCDTSAAFPYDNGRKAQGIGYNALDLSVAVPACTDAVARYPDSGRLHFQLGRVLEKANRIADAITAYRRASELGHGGGFNNLGELYRDGKGLPRDSVQAEQLFRQGAALKYPEAQFNLANLLLKKPGNANIEQTRELLSAAVAAGYVDAALTLQALGPAPVPVIPQPSLADQQRAAEEARQRELAEQQAAQQRSAEEARQRQVAEQQAARQRSAEEARQRQVAEQQATQQRSAEEAQQRHAEYLRRQDETRARSRAVLSYNNKDYSEAFKIWTELAQQGDPESQYNLGVLYNRGQGVTQDYNEAMRWFKAAAEQDYSLAQLNVGLHYLSGLGVTQDSDQAARWVKIPAEKGEPLSQLLLGAMYADGNGVAQDDKEAERWFKAAAAQGNADAKTNLERLARKPLVKELLSNWPELAAASDYDVLVMARNANAPNIVKKLGGGITSTTGTAALCVGALYPEEQQAEPAIKSALLDQLVRSRLIQQFQIKEVQPIAKWSGAQCTLNQTPWDFFDINKFGLISRSAEELRWLISNRKDTMTTAILISNEEFTKFLTEKREAEERKVAELARRDAEQIAQRKENARLIEQGDKSGWLSSENRLFIIATGSNSREVCYIAEAPNVEEQRRLLILGILADKSMIEREPMLGNSGQARKMSGSDEIFQRVQRDGCSLVAGTPNELKQLFVEGLPNIGRRDAFALSVVLDKPDIERLIALGSTVETEKKQAEEAKRQAEQKAEEAKRQAEQKAEDERQAAAILRESQGIVAVAISCSAQNGVRLPLIQCLGSSGSIRITDRGDTKEFKPYNLGTTMAFSRDLSPPWEVFAQSGGNDFVTLHAAVIGARGQHLSDEASGYHAILLSPQ